MPRVSASPICLSTQALTTPTLCATISSARAAQDPRRADPRARLASDTDRERTER